MDGSSIGSCSRLTMQVENCRSYRTDRRDNTQDMSMVGLVLFNDKADIRKFLRKVYSATCLSSGILIRCSLLHGQG